MEPTESISCIAVGDMLKKRLGEYTDALASGADKATLDKMENEIDKIEAVHDKCVDMGNVTDVDTPSNVVDEAECEDSTDNFTDETEFSMEEDEAN